MGNSDHNSQAFSNTSISELALDLPALRPLSKESPIRGKMELRCESPTDVEKCREEISTTISSLQVSQDKNRLRIIGKMAYSKSKEIGLSGNGTIVYEGSYDNIPAAVKRIPQRYVKLADQEIKNFLASSPHQNVVICYGVERKNDFVYIALELCVCNLDDLINQTSSEDSFEQYELVSNDGVHCSTISVSLSHDIDRLEPLKNKLGDIKLWKENNCGPSPLLLKLMRDMVSGLVHLHASRLVHRDLKPQNVLIIKQGLTLCAKLSDMGISRKLREDKNSLTNHYSRCGTTGWKPKEWLQFKHQTQAMDMFSLGCLFFWCITRGMHPFGKHYEREANIVNDNVKNLFLIKDFPEAFHLISLLLKADHLSRPEAIKVLHHPLFWSSKKRLSFLSDTDDSVSDNSDLFKALESAAGTILGTERKYFLNVVQSWSAKVDDKIIKHIDPYADFKSVRDLLRLIKTLLNRYEQLPKDIQILVGPLYEGVDGYLTSRFPMLLIEVYKVICTYCKEEVYFKKYFEGN